ncbi:hypothetical protein F4561_002571 [Lipingzhangella halophila]|uniref:Uncharacterized protein n=1 Tax=Lipingzhangella halophila TaxID=1783352 RepID=A0A7W7RHW0_9ACTN|nr:hypothetical protein [Lipingzhangella halophila]MBB4931751.1 hypothetical protein [Lipingzhangella halophila]
MSHPRHLFFRYKSVTVLILLIQLALLALAAFLIAREAPGGRDELQDYEAAERCQSASPGPADCLRTYEFTVAEVTIDERGRDHTYRAILTDTRGDEWQTDYGNPGPVLEHLDKGDRVTGTVWRGMLTEIEAEGASQETSDAPADMRARVLILGIMIIPACLLIVGVCVWRLRSAEPATGMGLTLYLAIWWFLAGGASPLILGTWLGDSVEESANVWMVALLWLVLAALLTAATRGGLLALRHMTAQTAAFDRKFNAADKDS